MLPEIEHKVDNLPFFGIVSILIPFCIIIFCVYEYLKLNVSELAGVCFCLCCLIVLIGRLMWGLSGGYEKNEELLKQRRAKYE